MIINNGVEFHFSLSERGDETDRAWAIDAIKLVPGDADCSVGQLAACATREGCLEFVPEFIGKFCEWGLPLADAIRIVDSEIRTVLSKGKLT